MILHFLFGSIAEQYVLLFTLKLSLPESHRLKKVKSCNFISAPQTVHLALYVEESLMHLCLSLSLSLGSCFHSGKARHRSFAPMPKWCWWAVSWTWGQMWTPWGNSPNSVSSLSPTSRWEPADDVRSKQRSGVYVQFCSTGSVLSLTINHCKQ